MAQQPKSYKKFVATAATATLVASALVPVASAASSSFTDVPASYTDAVDYLVSKGANGLSATQFGISKEITRGDAAVLLAGALGVLDANAPDSGFTDVPARATAAVNSLKAAGIINGKTATSFGFGDNLKRGEVALIIANGYGLKGDASKLAFTDVSERYASAVAALVEAKVTSGISATKFGTDNNIKRGDFAKFAFGLKDGVPEVVTEPKVESVSATNLKEVVLTFNTAVDKATAGEAAYYSITGANSTVEVDKVIVAEDAKSVTVTVKGTFVNQNEYKISFNNIKVGEKVFSAKDLAFKPLDNTVPTVSKVEALGNKTVRVSFSEPVKTAQTSQFKIDDKVVVGSIQTAGNTAIIKLSTTLTDGEHTLTAEGIQDFNDFRVIKAETKFNVVEDKTPPTVAAVVSASFEKVVLKFSEPVEQVFASNVYWMQGTTKKVASKVKALSDDTFEFEFTSTNKLVYTTDLFVTNVKDYSGNVIDKDTKVQVSPVIDQTRPEVLSTGFVKDSNNKQIVLKFSKSLNLDTAKKASNYVIKDKDGKTQAISSNVDTSKDKEVTITVLNTLKDDSDYTLTVNGVSDNTTLNNVMLPYTTTLSVKDITAPTFDGVTRLNVNQLYVQFSEAMATSGDGSVVDSSKYTITTGGKTVAPTSFDITADSKGVLLGFNNNDLPVHGTLINVKVQLVKDLAGNYLQNLSANHNVATADTTTVKSAVATATDKVEVTFTNALQSLNESDFSIVNGPGIAYAELSANGKVATFTLNTDLNENAQKLGTEIATGDSVELKVVAKPTSVDVLGERIAENIANVAIEDEISATVKSIANTATNQITITFNEAVNVAASAATDFTVKDQDGKAVGFTVAQPGAKNEVVVTLSSAVDFATLSVTDARFITDIVGNKITNIDARTIEMN